MPILLASSRRRAVQALVAAVVAATAALTGCGASAASDPSVVASQGPQGLVGFQAPRGAPAKQLVGHVESDGWHGIVLPTMQTLAVPVLDFVSPIAAWHASSYVDSHEAAFRSALGAQPAPVASRVAALRERCQDNALADAALLHLFLAGKLTAPARGGIPQLLDSLEAISGGQVAPGVDATALLHQLLAELDVPGRICQGIKLTCEAASVQIMLAERDPAAYAHLVAQLAAPAGTAQLAGGDTITRAQDWNSPTDGWRSLPSRLIQPAFAALGNAPLTYDNTHDRNSLGQSGLTDPQLAKLCTAVFGVPFRFLAPADSSYPDHMAAFEAALARGWQVPVWLDWFTGHVVLAEADSQGRVRFDNPMGAIHSVTDAVFEQRLHSVYVPVTP